MTLAEGRAIVATAIMASPTPFGLGSRPIYREVLFELVGGQAATPLFRALAHASAANARLQSIVLGRDAVSVLIDYVGEPEAVQVVRDAICQKAGRTMLRHDTLVDEPRHLRFVATWTRGEPHLDGVSLEHILYETVGPGGLLFGRVEHGIICYKAAAPEGAGLQQFLVHVKAALNGRFKVRPIRMGIFRPGWEIDDTPTAMAPEEEALLAAAFAAGYYDEPKRCGVRELGDALGLSKSVVARKLRLLERRALERLSH